MKKTIRALLAILTLGSTLYVVSGSNASAQCGDYKIGSIKWTYCDE